MIGVGRFFDLKLFTRAEESERGKSVGDDRDRDLVRDVMFSTVGAWASEC